MSKLTLHCAITAENGKRVTISIDNNPTTTTPSQLRTQVATATKIPLSQLRLIFRGRMIKDDDDHNNVNVVKEYKLEDECVLHCMGKPTNDATSAAATTTAPPAPSVANAPTISATTTTTTPSATATAATTTTPAAGDPLMAALELLRTHASSPDVYTTALTTLDKILSNIISHPMEEKYRKVKVHNAAFGKRLGNLVGGKQAMLAVGFIEDHDDNANATIPIYKMQASPEAWPALQHAKATLEQALTRAKQATATSSNTPSPMMFPNPTTTGTTGFPGMPGSGIPNNNPMAAAAMAQNILSNPEALQNMMQNPMVQQMIQNDPNIPPHARQAMQSLSNNPAMMNQLSQMMMNDPMVRNQMMQSMGGTGMPGGGGGGTMMPNLMPGMSSMGGNAAANNNNNNSNANNTNNNNNNNTGGEGNDESTTEDEMIAEAIRRSLEES
eukprot:scaffold6966_cov112-Cylindrotheca_fusiformis.AAC.29